jgi:two-component system sensor histidine kinase KdpD
VAPPASGLSSERLKGHQEVRKAIQLAKELGAEVVTVESKDAADAIVKQAQELEVTQIVMGESTRSWLGELLHGSVIREVLRRTNDIDVHIVQRSDVL